MHKIIYQALKFGVVGGIATAIDFTVLMALTELCEWDPIWAAAISFVGSLVFNYLVSMRYVFKHREDISRGREFLLFLVLSAIGLGFNELIMIVGVDWASINYLITKVLATTFVMIWNFISRKLWLEG